MFVVSWGVSGKAINVAVQVCAHDNLSFLEFYLLNFTAHRIQMEPIITQHGKVDVFWIAPPLIFADSSIPRYLQYLRV
jgi:hypothetical protein